MSKYMYFAAEKNGQRIILGEYLPSSKVYQLFSDAAPSNLYAEITPERLIRALRDIKSKIAELDDTNTFQCKHLERIVQSPNVTANEKVNIISDISCDIRKRREDINEYEAARAFVYLLIEVADPFQNENTDIQYKLFVSPDEE